MGIGDLLQNMAGGGGSGSAPGVQLPGFDSGSAKALKDMKKQIKEINSLVKQGNVGWKQYARRDPLLKAAAATQRLAKAQKAFDKINQDSTKTIAEKADAYRDLSEAQKDAKDTTKEANKAINESRGALGRLKNVLDDIPSGPALIAGAIKDLSIVLKPMSENFTMMASRGKLAGKSMGDLAAETGKYMVQAKLASVQAAAVGISAEDSNAAFAKLTNTMGGGADALKEVSDSWGDLTKLATVTGLGMADVADLADQGFKRLGETLEETKNNVAAMSNATKEMNQRWGKAAPTVQQFAGAVKELAYAEGFYNQNTRMVIDSLAREISMQLALGKTQEAATKIATKNLKMAGDISIAGVAHFRDDLVKQYKAAQAAGEDATKVFLAQTTEKFGAQGEMVASMLERGTLNDSANITLIQKLFKDSSEMQGVWLEKMRGEADKGNINLMLKSGIKLEDARMMVEESQLMGTKIEAIRRGEEGAEQALFGKDADLSSDENKEFLAKIRDPNTKMTAGRMRALKGDFRKMAGADDASQKAAEEALKGREPVPEYKKLLTEIGGAAHVKGAFEVINTLPGLLNQLPIWTATALGGILAKGVLGKILRNLPSPVKNVMGRNVGGMVSQGLSKIGVSPKAMKALKMLGKGGLIGAAVAAAGTMAYGFYNAAEILDKAPDTLTFGDRMAGGAAQLAGVFGADKGMVAKWITNMGQSDLHDVDVNESDPGYQDRKAYEHAKSKGYSSAAGTFEEWKANRDKMEAMSPAQKKAHAQAMRQRQTASTKTTTSGTDPPNRDGSGGAGGSASGVASMSGNSLILEVENWQNVIAQTNESLGASEA